MDYWREIDAWTEADVSWRIVLRHADGVSPYAELDLEAYYGGGFVSVGWHLIYRDGGFQNGLELRSRAVTCWRILAAPDTWWRRLLRITFKDRVRRARAKAMRVVRRITRACEAVQRTRTLVEDVGEQEASNE